METKSFKQQNDLVTVYEESMNELGVIKLSSESIEIQGKKITNIIEEPLVIESIGDKTIVTCRFLCDEFISMPKQNCPDVKDLNFEPRKIEVDISVEGTKVANYFSASDKNIRCSVCGKADHRSDAIYCGVCGNKIKIVKKGVTNGR